MAEDPGDPDGDRTAAAEVWRLLLSSAMAQFGRTSQILVELGLTPGHMRALLMLDPGEPRPIGALAHSFACDASTMTWLVDRLEERGLVERRGSASDRRVRTVALTEQGLATKAELERRLYDPPPELRAIDPGALVALRSALQAMATPSG
ncbi:MAG: MarR family winged helix-turn-helix transcriptional regulator [Mycobacteriales bacterium]